MSKSIPVFAFAFAAYNATRRQKPVYEDVCEESSAHERVRDGKGAERRPAVAKNDPPRDDVSQDRKA